MRTVLRSLVLLGAVGCSSASVVVVDGIELYEKHWNAAKSELSRRAAFEFNCPEAQLEFTLLKKDGRAPTQIAVVGCGHRGLYERFVIRGAYGATVARGDWRLASSTVSR